MKRVINYIIVSLFLLFSSLSYAEISVGIKGGNGELTGKDKTADVLNKSTKSADADFGAIFIEGKLPSGNLPFSVSLGLEYIPLEAVIDGYSTTGADGNTDAEMTVKDHITIYAQIAKELKDGFSGFAKVGYVTADISNVKTATATLTSKDSSLSGYTYGIGIQKNFDTRFVNFVRIGYDEIKYDDPQAASSEHTYKAEADVKAYYLSIGKTF